MTKNRIISSDSHVVEPPNLWEDRMDKRKWGNLTPHLGNDGGKYDWWFVGDRRAAATGAVAAAGKRFERPEDIIQAGIYKDIRPGAFIPSEHVKDMDVDGVYGGVVYPSAGLAFFGLEDTRLVRAIFSAYNDWLANFCAHYPERIKGVGAVVLDDDIGSAVEDMEGVTRKGLAGVMISSFPRTGERYYLPKYEPFWAAAEELNAPLSLHVTTNRFGGPQILKEGRQALNATDRCNNDYFVRQSLGDIVYSGVLERHPKLKIVSVEHELGWIPFFTSRMDVYYRDRPDVATYRFKDGAVPSDFMKRQVYHGFQEDVLGIELRHHIGVTQMLWGSDYPHAESTFPRSREILDQILEGVPEGERRLIEGGNSARVYGFKQA
ncbi:MAG: amidohydrolase [SAR202 cluster bacterium]|nr:amidohydrolase [SAR202 cluster bacterium]